MNESNPKLSDLPSALAEMQRLREENVRLRCLLQEHGIQIPAAQSTTEISVTTNALPSAHTPVLKAEQRIALFRSLFHGRDDVYAVRWENTDGRSGYMPKADRDWKAYFRAKDEDRKKVDRQTRKFRPLTDEVVRGHLVGDHTIGVYPLLQDETCWFLAVDFDKKTWQRDATAFLAVCCELNVPAALERSRSDSSLLEFSIIRGLSDSGIAPVEHTAHSYGRCWRWVSQLFHGHRDTPGLYGGFVASEQAVMASFLQRRIRIKTVNPREYRERKRFHIS